MQDWKASDAETDPLLVPTNFARLCAKFKRHKNKEAVHHGRPLVFSGQSPLPLAVFDFRKLIQELILIYYMKNT